MSMGIQQAFVTCLKKYADFSGRATRPEYWWFVLCEVLILGIASLISDTLPGLFALALVLPALAVGARRLHDTGRSGWWLLLMLVPFMGACSCCTGRCCPASRAPTRSANRRPDRMGGRNTRVATVSHATRKPVSPWA